MPFSMLCVYVCGFKQHIFMIVIYVYEIASQHSIRLKSVVFFRLEKSQRLQRLAD